MILGNSGSCLLLEWKVQFSIFEGSGGCKKGEALLIEGKAMSKHQSQNGIALMMVLSLVSHSLRTRQEMNIGSPNVTQSWEFKQIRANTSYYMGDNILLCRNIVYDGLRQMANNYIYIIIRDLSQFMAIFSCGT